MNTAHIDTDIDWLACELIEQVPGKVSGRPIVRGTRIMPDQIVNSSIKTLTTGCVKHLASHAVFTASYKGWYALKNGELLDAAEAEGFDVLVSGDKTLSHEQNLTGRRLAIVALSAVEWRIIKDYLRRIVTAVNSAAPGPFQEVNCGTFSRKKVSGQ